MKKIALRIVAIILLLSAQVAPAFAEAGTSTHRARCKSNKAIAYRPVLESGVKFKTNSQELQLKLSRLDTDLFCDCIYEGFEKAFGAQKVNEMMQYIYTPTPEQLMKEDAEKDRICFACFGEQIGQPNLLPPSIEETRQTLSRPNPNQTMVLARQTKGNLAQIVFAIQMYQDDKKKLPSQLSDLTNPNSAYIKVKDLKDAWNKDIVYKSLGTSFEVRSAGPDGITGTDDDITP